MSELSTHVVRLRDVTSEEAETAIWKIMETVTGAGLSLKDSEQLWHCYRDFVSFVLASHGELPTNFHDSIDTDSAV